MYDTADTDIKLTPFGPVNEKYVPARSRVKHISDHLQKPNKQKIDLSPFKKIEKQLTDVSEYLSFDDLKTIMTSEALLSYMSIENKINKRPPSPTGHFENQSDEEDPSEDPSEDSPLPLNNLTTLNGSR
jgi:hypothetical protein